MAYQSKNLSVLAYANGFTLWHYVTPDSGADVSVNGYFNDSPGILRVGDIIVANLDADGRNPGAGIFLVRAIAGGVVGVSSMVGD